MYRYPWPASAITKEHMAVLHHIREGTHPKVPITRLIAEAVTAQYGDAREATVTTIERKEAA